LLPGGTTPDRRYERDGERARLVLPVDVAPPYTAAVSVERLGRALTRRDERLLHSAALTLSAWLRAVSNRLAGAPERRRVSRSFEQIIEQHIASAAAQSEDVAVIVLSFGAEPRGAETTLAWIGNIRRLLRPADVAGRLSSGDIGVLLPDTSDAGAAVVLARLRGLIESPDGHALWPYASFGMASQAAGSPRRALLVEAQAKAAMGRRPPPPVQPKI
jgi:GGDEF domain-containing protein